MDAKAHLISLGWLGPGHALDSKPYKQKGHRGLDYNPNKEHNSGKGLVKPLLISQHRGNIGIGKKAHEAPGGNDWWLKGFETALSNIGKSDGERSSGTSTPVNTGHGSKHTGLYGYFVKGQEMSGTIGLAETARNSKKRKSDGTIKDLESPESSEGEDVERFTQVSAFMAERDRNEKRRARSVKASEAEQFAQIGQFFEARSDTPRKDRDGETKGVNHIEVLKPAIKAELRKKKKSKSSDGHTTEESSHTETKEERRARRRKRKEEAAALKTVPVERAGDTADYVDSDGERARAARRVERRRRKEQKAQRSAS